ncbi:MAG: hypothetical protein P1U80_05205 [Pseudomonadales bacterium]|jgi:hypothetical protein|nr:hypothetical protein [Pseudomonadales bacterium]
MKKEWIYKSTMYFGWLNVVGALLCLVTMPFYDLAAHGLLAQHSGASIASMAFLQCLVGGSLVYSSKQRVLGSDLGEKAYPASLVSFLLFALIGSQWI